MPRNEAVHVREWPRGVAILVLTISALAQAPPAVLQESGNQRITRFIEHFRRTGDTRSMLGELRQAELELNASHQAFLAAGQLAQASWSLVKLADCRRMQDQSDEAKQLYLRALALAKQAGHAGYQAKALIGLARVEQLGTREFGSAALHLEEAIRLTATAADQTFYLDALEEKAALETTQGQLVPALQSLERLRDLLKGRPEDARLFFVYYYEADAYRKMADPCSTQTQRDFPLCRQTFDLAKANYEQARALAAKLGYNGLASEMSAAMKRLQISRQMLEMNEKMTAQLANLRVFEPKKAEDVQVTETFAAGAQQIPPDLAALARSTLVDDARGIYVEASLLEMQGQSDAALARYLKAIELLERDRRSLRDEASRGSFLEDKILFYDPPILHLLDQRRYAEAFDLLERSRSRAMADLLASRPIGLSNPTERSMYTESVKLRAEIGRIQKDLLLLGTSGSKPNTQDIAAAQARIRELEVGYDLLLKRMSREAPRLRELNTSVTIPLRELQAIMRRDSFDVIHYMVQQNGVIVWHIGSAGVHVRNVFLPPSELKSKVSELHRSVVDPNTVFNQQRARELFLFLVQPVLGFVESRQLVIIPHEELHGLPFQVLIDSNGAALGEQFQITYAPSATIIARLRKVRNLAGGQLFAAADPSLNHAREEVAAIAKMYSGRAKVVDNVLLKESELKQEVGDHEVVHLAVHGQFDAREPLLSHLKLAADAVSDGQLTAAEMFGLPLERTTLVTLSACESGQSLVTESNEVLGMQRALLYAGAQNLLLSSWKVDSEATSLWMQSFYREAQSKPVAEAARLALSTVKRMPSYHHPFYWGAFQLVGK